MNRLIPAVTVAAAATFALAACGAAASAARSSASPSPGANTFRNGTSGQLFQINGQTLIVTGPNGDTTVTYSTTTTFTKTSLGTLADITRGSCILATGQKDTAGAVTATTVVISPKTSTGCANRTFVPPTPAPGASPRPSPTARPSGLPNGGFANAGIVSGQVTAISGPLVTVLTQAKVSQTVTVASAATITDSATVSASALQNGQCVRATGPLDAAGNVQATSITITPAGPSGTCTTGFGGGGRRFPGAGGGAAPSAGTTTGG
jgi:hypothetical protein